MQYKMYDSDGKLLDVGICTNGSLPNVETHGSLHLELSPGRWLNIRTSEWIVGEISDKPKTWKDSHEEHLNSMKQFYQEAVDPEFYNL